MKDYVIGTDKVLAKLDTPNLEGWVTVTNLKELQTYAKKPIDREQFPEPIWKGSKFPAALMQQVLGTIHEFPRMETAYSLYYNIHTKEWAVKCPEQNGGGASVSYGDDGTGMPEGFTIIGSIHTHPEMQAFWSGTDLNDQQKKHGIHFVFGLHDGLVRYSLVTVFTPTEQFNQDIHDVVEDFDWAQVYPAVPEWVETIKKQSYHRYVPPAKTYNWYGGYAQQYKRPLKNRHYGKERSVHENYDDYVYTGGVWDGYGYQYDDDYYNYPYGRSYGNRIADYEADIDVPSGSAASSYEVLDDKAEKYINIIDDALNNAVKAEAFRAALVDTQTRSVIENELDLVVVDGADKIDILEGVEELATLIQKNEKTDKYTNEEAKEIVGSMLEALPEVNLIEPTDPAFRNGSMMDAIVYLISGMVDSYCENPNCIDSEDIGNMLTCLKESYDTLLRVQAEQDTEEQAGAEEC